MGMKQNGVTVVMVPLPAQGHLNQLLHLTRIISTHGLPVHFTSSSTHNRQAKDRVHGWDPSTISNIHFHDFEFPQVIPLSDNPNASRRLPSHTIPTYKACVTLRKPLGLLLRDLASTHRRVVVVYDSIMAFAAHEASFVSNAEAYSFVPSSAFGVLHTIWEALGQEESILPKDVPRVAFQECYDEGFSELIDQNIQYMNFRAGDIYNTCEAIEGRFIHLFSQFQKDKSLWAVGPFNPVQVEMNGSFRHHCLEWLDKQNPSSVIYVSFGTAASLSDNQVVELANGLEHSGQRFIWVLRDADRGDIYNEEGRRIQLPDGFEERVKGVGLVVRDWAPQLQILAHKSTGGFLSHCGWNSTLESLTMGVPMAAWPMHSDQPRVALLVTGVLKVGLVVREWSRREELISSDEISCSVRNLMVLDEGNMMRTRAKELGFEVRRAVSEGGSSTNQLESFLAHISR